MRNKAPNTAVKRDALRLAPYLKRSTPTLNNKINAGDTQFGQFRVWQDKYGDTVNGWAWRKVA